MRSVRSQNIGALSCALVLAVFGTLACGGGGGGGSGGSGADDWTQDPTVKWVGGAGADFASLTEAVEYLNANGPGDQGVTFAIRAGTYTGHMMVSASGDAERGIAFRAAPGEQVVVEASPGQPAFHVDGGSYVTLQDLAIHGAGSHGVWVEGRIAVSGDAAQELPAAHVTIRDCVISVEGAAGQGPGDIAGVCLEYAPYAILEGLTIDASNATGVLLKSASVKIGEQTVNGRSDNVAIRGSSIHVGGDGFMGIFDDGACGITDLAVEANHFDGSGGADTGISAGSTGFKNLRLANNAIQGFDTYGIRLRG